jgi:hypothetical protein
MTGKVNARPLGRRRWPQAVTIVILTMLAWLTALLVIRMA